MKRYVILLIIFLFVFFCPSLAMAEDAIFEARVLRILETQKYTRQDGSEVTQQKIKMEGLQGEWKSKEIIYNGISEIDVVSQNVYKEGDRVIVSYTKDFDGNDQFYITDYVRRGSLFWLLIIFILTVIIIGRWKGFRALVSLLLTFVVIIFFILPRILAGDSPLLIAIIGSVIILFFIVYLTEGFNRRSHTALVSILIALVITGLISIIFTYLTRLTGMASEEAMHLLGLGENAINFQGLLLAGIMIGTLGVLDDMVISQVAAVEQIKIANPSLSKKEVFKKSYKIGISHISSMTNTLFLAYAGAALPLLLLFSVKQVPFLTFSQVINNEMIATEIVRTLTGSIGLVLAVPIATILAVHFIKAKQPDKIKND